MCEAEDVASRGAGGAGWAAGWMEALLLYRWRDDWAAEGDAAAAMLLLWQGASAVVLTLVWKAAPWRPAAVLASAAAQLVRLEETCKA